MTPRGRARAASDHGPMLEAECVRLICTDGVHVAAAHFGVTEQTARRWASQWGVPASVPDLSPHTVAVATRAIIDQFRNATKETPMPETAPVPGPDAAHLRHRNLRLVHRFGGAR